MKICRVLTALFLTVGLFFSVIIAIKIIASAITSSFGLFIVLALISFIMSAVFEGIHDDIQLKMYHRYSEHVMRMEAQNGKKD